MDNSYLQPWMVEVVKSSLPYLVDSSKIREISEEGEGNMDAEVSKLLEVLPGRRKGDVVKRTDMYLDLLNKLWFIKE